MAAEGSLKRLGGGRWQTRDERFSIESEGGSWVVVDAETTDELGLPRVHGPFGSLTAAKEAIAAARTAPMSASPLEERLAEVRRRPRRAPEPEPEPETGPEAEAEPEPEPEPAWLADMPEGDRDRARDLVERLESEGVDDAVELVRADLAGDRPLVAETLLRLRVDARVAEALAVGRGRLDPAGAARLARDILALAADPDAADAERAHHGGADPRWVIVEDGARRRRLRPGAADTSL